MPRVVIKVAGVEAPKPGKKRGRVIDESGTKYQIAPVLMDMVKTGSTYEIDYKDDEFQGSEGLVKFRVIESLVPATGGAPTPPMRRSYDQEQARPIQHAIAPDTKTEDISVLAIMKSQQIKGGDREAIFHCLKQSALAWRDYKKWQASAASDMSDEIPDGK